MTIAGQGVNYQDGVVAGRVECAPRLEAEIDVWQHVAVLGDERMIRVRDVRGAKNSRW